MPDDSFRLTHRELDVMSILWRSGSGTVSEVRAALADRLAYTTVLWVLQTLEEKGRVRHEKEGRAYRYYPLLELEVAGGNALGRLVDKVFHGSASLLLAQLVSERELPPDELRRMRDLLDRRLKEEGAEEAEEP
ncbi:MAG TPA: BlaI/MecI/CopY family transcriptional regulator [Longimicrobiaceae bacterium]|nr:BlaI/MecI/CopY family transcriptional regulator [Longimicrobiaceae bacterium]